MADVTPSGVVNEEKKSGGLFFRSDTPQSKEKSAETIVYAYFDYATGELSPTASEMRQKRPV